MFVPESGKFNVNSEMLGLGPMSETLCAALCTVLNAVLAVVAKMMSTPPTQNSL